MRAIDEDDYQTGIDIANDHHIVTADDFDFVPARDWAWKVLWARFRDWIRVPPKP